MNYVHEFTAWFWQLSRKQKISLSLSTAFILCATLTLSIWVLSPSYAVLFTQLDEQDASKIVNQLESSQIPYQLRHDGRDILIDKDLIAKTRLNIMSSGLNLAGSVGFELFDKNDFGMTDFSQKINYQRALQGELERTIVSFEEISQARVHLVIPETHLFTQEQNQPKAAVTVHLKSPLTAKQVQSIQQLVSASVAHLSLKNVVVVDHNGNTLSSNQNDLSNSNQLTNKKTIETYLTHKVTPLLEQIFPNQHVMVKVDVLLNYDELQRERVQPQTQGLVTHEKQIEHHTGDKTAKDKQKQDITSEKSYELGHEKELFKRAHGTIERLSISVVLPKNTPLKTQEQVQRIVKNTIGFDSQRGDLISVEALIAEQTTPVVNESSLPSLIINTSKDMSLLPYYLAFILCSGTAGVLLLRKKNTQKREALLIELTQWLDQHD
jgi:flagellar M-ring protein FliF